MRPVELLSHDILPHSLTVYCEHNKQSHIGILMQSSEGKEWRKLLQPLVTAAVAALTVYTYCVQTNQEEKTDSRLTALEIRADVTDKRSDKFGSDIDNFKVLLGDIRSDVSFIRGKLEGGKGR